MKERWDGKLIKLYHIPDVSKTSMKLNVFSLTKIHFKTDFFYSLPYLFVNVCLLWAPCRQHTLNALMLMSRFMQVIQVLNNSSVGFLFFVFFLNKCLKNRLAHTGIHKPYHPNWEVCHGKQTCLVRCQPYLNVSALSVAAISLSDGTRIPQKQVHGIFVAIFWKINKTWKNIAVIV